MGIGVNHKMYVIYVFTLPVIGTSRAPLLTGVDPSGLFLLTLFLSVPPTPVRQLVAALAGVQVLAHLPGPLLEAPGQATHHLDVLHLGALRASVAAVTAPYTTQGGRQA